MKAQTTLSKLLPAVALAAIFSLCAATSAQAAFNGFKTGMFGVARGQIARINAVNVGNPNERPIEIEMMFLDEMGVVVGRDMKTIAPGEAAFFDVMFDPTREENRVPLRAVVVGLGGPDTRNLKTTVEVFDADTGRNTVLSRIRTFSSKRLREQISLLEKPHVESLFNTSAQSWRVFLATP